MPDKQSGEIRMRDDKVHNSIELLVPKGFTAKDLSKVNIGELISKFRPSGCGACLSGQDFNIREKFERVLPVDIEGKVQVGH